ncbi:PREDICTED: transcription factor A, mitochondrial [Dinoponera quadriceps]|uniref:Transcription factor A, mitochondrial n=1 Tax=Dinoponera quadriceps TaxID=609295 RepID=A0A6P3XE41_DINQU|nr:PREDICTED: transcription factor A, mitochondrial [Dinoponera quadriceps]XP_014476631.1 PREDICTED: transcription factor A, mitochondrial [Dinoponera quadriceps]XP_014476632.1 PREDICTED: transcription factor A, mitochondrial [Dinoponera quadriceps]
MNMATWRLLSPNGPVNILCTRKLATIKSGPKLKHDVEKTILPQKPKKPLNAYLLYFQSIKSKWQQEHPDIKYIELVKKISQEWTKVDLTIKQQLQKQHEDEFAIYKQKLDAYNNSLTKEQRILIIDELKKKKNTSEKNQTKKKLMELGKPKRPLSAYFIFMMNKKADKDSTISQKEWVKNISNEWNNMTTKDKDKYYTEAKQLQEKYNSELKKWVEDMIKSGHSDLLNSHHLLNSLDTKSKRNDSVNKHKE